MVFLQNWAADFADTFTRCFINDDRYMLLVKGMGITVMVSLLAAVIGVLIGMLIALCNLSKNKALQKIGGIYTDVRRKDL